MAYFDGQYNKHHPRPLTRGGRKPWRAFLYTNNRRYYLGNFRTKEEAEEVERKEKLRRQRELLEEYPDEIKSHRQLSLLDTSL
jgi:hypothetical protein